MNQINSYLVECGSEWVAPFGPAPDDSSLGGASRPIIFLMPGLCDELGAEGAVKWMSQNDERLKPHIVSVPKAWRKGMIANHRFPRDCFGRAIQFVHRSPHLPNALYVLGETLGGGMQQHGWVELDDRVVFDGVMQQFYDKAGYYVVEQARPWYRFTRPAVMFMNRKRNRDASVTYRWDWELRLPCASDPANPLLVDLEHVKLAWKKRPLSRSSAA